MKKLTIVGVVAAVIILLIVWLAASSSKVSVQSTVSNSTAQQSPTTHIAPKATVVTISNFAFNSSNITVPKGTRVTWVNNDSMTHTVTGTPGGPSSGNLGKGGTYSFTFNTVGIFNYHCAIHPGMVGTVTLKHDGIIFGLICAALIAGGLLVYWFSLLNVAHSSFDDYYRFRGCQQLVEKTDTYGTCKLADGKIIKIVLTNGKWYLDGDGPGIW